MILTPRVKESIKTALAMTIAYGIALSMDWDRPYWAGFAVTFISLSTVGQSLNKGALRLLGTLLALVVSLLIIGLFVQDRWWFMVALSAWVGFCTYRMTVSSRSYFWFLAGFASVVISMDGGLSPVHAFDTAVLRAQETALGVLVYTLVTTLLWPTSSHAGFETVTRALAQAQRRLYSGYRDAMLGGGPKQANPDHGTISATIHDTPALIPDPGLRAAAIQYDQLLAQFGATLEAALTDSYHVMELRQQWRHFQRQSTSLRETLEQWHQNTGEIRGLDMDVLLPAYAAAMQEIEQRLVETERLLGDQAIQHRPAAIDLSYDPARLRALSHFHVAAFATARDGLRRLDRLTRDQFDTLVDIKGLAAADQSGATRQATPKSIPASNPPSGQGAISAPASKSGFAPIPGPDGMIAAVRAMVGLWSAYLLWIYFTVPGGTGIISMIAPVGMILATNPRLPPLIILIPVMVSIAFAGGLYVFVMPQLSSFIGLGAMLFILVFVITYVYSTPRMGMVRSIALAISLTVIGVSNEQSYSFLSVVDTFVMFGIDIVLLTLISRFPFTMQPDKAFLRLLGRFFRSSEYLLTTMRWDPVRPPTHLDNWKRAFHARQVATLPQAIENWGKTVDTRVLPGTTVGQVQALADTLQALANRLRELMDTRTDPQAALLVHELLSDLRIWRLGMQEALQLFSSNPSAAASDHLRDRLLVKLEHLEGRIEETLNKTGKGEISTQESENFYRLLGAFRGLSDAVIAYAVAAQRIDWEPWRESRF